MKLAWLAAAVVLGIAVAPARAIAEDAGGMLEKPVTAQQLREAVRSATDALAGPPRRSAPRLTPPPAPPG